MKIGIKDRKLNNNDLYLKCDTRKSPTGPNKRTSTILGRKLFIDKIALTLLSQGKLFL